MKRALSSLRQHVLGMRVAYLVLVLSLLATGVVYYRVRANVEMRERTRFERVVREEQAAIERRIPRYVDEMLGVRGLFAAIPTVSSEQWQRYVERLEIKRFYPGFRTLGYLEMVSRAERDNFLKHSRSREGSGYGIDPEGEREVYFPTVYLNRFEPGLNGRLGHDHFANPERQKIMTEARDKGQPIATGRMSWPNPANTNEYQAGFLIYLPVYRAGAKTGTVSDRRAALEGFIFASLEADKLLEGIPGPQPNPIIDCEIFDGEPMTAEHLLHDEDKALHGAEQRPRQHSEKVTIPMLNRTWTLYFCSLPAFEAESQHNLPAIALTCWLTLSLLLFGLTAAEVKSRARAEKITANLRKSEAALAAETERLAVTLYSIGDGVISTDTAGKVVSLNKVAEQLTGWKQMEAAGKPLVELFKIVNENTREPLADPAETVLRTGSGFNLDQPTLLIARDGTERAISDSAAPIRNREGGVIGTVVVFRDVTAKQKTEAELLKESKLESVGLLAGGIAHDFNNILQGILGNLSLARMNAHSTEKMLERLAGVEKSALRARDLTQQLVMFARGGAPIRKQVQLTNIIKDATLFALHGSTVTCEFSLAADIWAVEVDEGQFRQVINNMVMNAVQAMPEGGKIEVRSENVEVTAGHLPPLGGGKYVKISIRDYGTGIRPEHLPRIFDPYFTTRKHARGLGLASAYSVIRKHDGQINVDTQVGRGSNFQIYLPASLKNDSKPEHDTEQTQFFGQGRVLVMDDEPDILSLVGEMLKLMGYDVETARDGAEALELYTVAKSRGNAFAAVIMDLTIPEGMGGKEAIRRLKVLDPEVKAIVSSGYSYDPVMANFQEFGFCGVIPKPYVMEQLGRVLEEVIGRKGTGTAAAPH